MKNWLNHNWKLLSSLFAVAFLLGAASARQGFAGIRIAGLEYGFIKDQSIPKSMVLDGKWFYRASASASDLRYDQLTCKSILGEANISHGTDGSANSSEFDIHHATRKVCIDKQNLAAKVMVGWKSVKASVLPEDRSFIISVLTQDPNPRIGYIEGSIDRKDPNDSEVLPDRFSGTMNYLNTKDQTFVGISIEFCKEGTECANNIEKQF
jgi:hypothetical protein